MNGAASSVSLEPPDRQDSEVAELHPLQAGLSARDRISTFAVCAALVVWAVALVAVGFDRYTHFRFARFDLGNMVQAVWSTADGRPLEMTHPTTAEQVVRFVFHVDPILALLTPLWIIAPTPLVLIAAQVIIVSLGALPVYWLARRHAESARTGAILALAYLAYPWVGWAALDAFHPVSLAIPLFLFAIWYLDNDRLVLFAVCAALAAATGELMGFLVGLLGIWYAAARGRRRAGAVITVLGVGWSAVALLVIVPAAAGHSSVYYGAFAEVGGSPLGIVRTGLTDPLTVLAAATEAGDLLYVFLLGAPLAFAFVLAPSLAWVALVPLGVNALSSFEGTTDPHEHYVSAVLPFLFASVAVGMSRLTGPARSRVAGLVLCLCLAATAATGPWPGTLLGAASWAPLPSSDEHVEALEHAIALVPPDASVSATNRVGSHLSARRYFYSVPAVGRADWIVLEAADDWIPQHAGGYANPEALERFRRRIERSPEWTEVFDRDGVQVFRRARA